MEEMTYTVLKAREEGVGGIMPVPPEAQGTPPHWGAYITVNDVDAVAKKAADYSNLVGLDPRLMGCLGG